MKTKEEILSEITGIPVYRIQADDGGEYITKKGALLAMEEYRSQPHQELPGDEACDEIAFRRLLLTNRDASSELQDRMLIIDGLQMMRSLASPAITSRDSRIRELEEALRSIEIGADPRNEYQAFSWIDTARSIANKVLTPPTQAEG